MSETNLNPVNAGPAEVVDQPTGVSVAAEPSNPDAGNGAAPGVANRGQSAEDNAKFADMRRKMEQAMKDAEQAKKDLAASKAQADRMSQLVTKQYGYEGDALSIADQLEAAATGKSVADIRAAREAAEEQASKLEKLEQELNLYRPLATEHFKAQLLADVKAIYPDVKATSVEEFGEEFTKLVAAGVPAAHAYAATKDVEQAQIKPTPPQIGAVNSKTAGESDYFTKDEVARMSKAEVAKNYEKIKKSMPTWGKH